ncbi:MAG: carboxylesterase family protein [Gammaproteobacteria bacterium]|nr:carboxylesterase family protein [Gammaproteobacteria bacterium]
MTQPYYQYLCLLLIALLLSACSPQKLALEQTALQVKTTEGTVEGLAEAGVISFKGIPFALPPVNELRWRAPLPPKTHNDVLLANNYGDFCAQPNSALLWFELTSSSEDCLTLNIWTPGLGNSAELPVMVWIHGGGYMQGSGNVARLNSAKLTKAGVVLVTINYRLNAFGFMAHPRLSESQNSEIHANFGVLDAIQALNWVKNNISGFGGNPENITIFGESAGGAMVNTLLVSPLSEGLFHKAISQSSALGLAPDALLSQRSGFQLSGEAMGVKLVKALGLTDSDDLIAELRALPAADIVEVIEPNWRFTPVIDGEVLTGFSGDIFAAGKQHDVPYITGGVSWEASLGRMIGGGFSPAMSARLVPKKDKERLYPSLNGAALEDAIFGDLIILAQARYVANNWGQLNSPNWHYNMSYIAEERRATQPGVAHTDDIAFVMRTLDAELANPSAQDEVISNLMSSYWVQFARTGNPNHPDLPVWPEYQGSDGTVMLFDSSPHSETGFLQERMEFHIERGEAFREQVSSKVVLP